MGSFFKNSFMERTLIILKPDCLGQGIAGRVIACFEDAGCGIEAAKTVQLDGDLLREHYAHVADKPFFPEIASFMSSRPVLVIVFAGENVVSKAREILGPTDSKEAPEGTIRGDMGTDKMRNIAHASDGPETARREIERFFPEGLANVER